MQRNFSKNFGRTVENHQSELLTAALMGAVVGAGIALIMKRRPHGAGALRTGINDIAEQFRDYIDETRDTMGGGGRNHLHGGDIRHGFRKAMRRRRRRQLLGL